MPLETAGGREDGENLAGVLVPIRRARVGDPPTAYHSCCVGCGVPPSSLEVHLLAADVRYPHLLLFA